MTQSYAPLNAAFIADIRAGGPDANGQPAERVISDGQGKPCRCCLDTVPAGAEMLIFAARPFTSLHPYAESGPVFLCADNCPPYEGNDLPPVLKLSPDYLVKAYSEDERIIYGTGQITPSDEVRPYAEALFARDDVAFVDVRSAKNNCILSRMRRP